MAENGATASFGDRLFEPVNGDPALRWKGSASMETTVTTETPPLAGGAPRGNEGRLIGQKACRSLKDVWTIWVRLQLERRKRDLAMCNRLRTEAPLV
jgi:hypothetical protein